MRLLDGEPRDRLAVGAGEDAAGRFEAIDDQHRVRVITGQLVDVGS